MFRRSALLGIAAMCVAMFGFITNDAQVKLASEELPIGEVIFLRGAFATLLVTGLVAATRQYRLWRTLRDRALLWRTVGDVGATLLYLTALTQLPLANGAIVLQVVPLAVTAAGAIFLREHVGWRRWSAVGVGLCGVIIVIRPGLDGFNPYSLLALLAVAFIVIRDLSTNRLGPAVPDLLVVLVAVAFGMAAGGALGLTEDWVWPSATLLAETAGAGLCLIIGHWFIIIALRAAPVSLTAPFNYTNVIWAIILELIIWSTRPDLVTLAGAALIVASGAYILYREQKGARRREPSIGGFGP